MEGHCGGQEVGRLFMEGPGVPLGWGPVGVLVELPSRA